MVIITLELIINAPDKRDEIIDLLAEINKSTASDEGLIIHDFFANLWEPNRIRLYVEYESRETALASEENAPPEWREALGRLFAYQEAGALTMEFENNLRRYELGAELPPFAVQPG